MFAHYSCVFGIVAKPGENAVARNAVAGTNAKFGIQTIVQTEKYTIYYANVGRTRLGGIARLGEMSFPDSTNIRSIYCICSV